MYNHCHWIITSSRRINISSGKYTNSSGRNISMIYDMNEKVIWQFAWALPKIALLVKTIMVIHGHHGQKLLFCKVCLKFKKENTEIGLWKSVISTILRTPYWRAKGTKLGGRYGYLFDVRGYFWRLMSQYHLGFNRWKSDVLTYLQLTFQNAFLTIMILFQPHFTVVPCDIPHRG